MGRKNKPTGQKIIEGTFRKDRANPNEPEYESDLPYPPPYLSENATYEWFRVGEILFSNGVATDPDTATLAKYCVSNDRWERTETKLAKEDYVVTTTNGNIIQNPLLGIANQAMISTNKFAVELGITPASRSKVSAKKKTKAGPWDAFKQVK